MDRIAPRTARHIQRAANRRFGKPALKPGAWMGSIRVGTESIPLIPLVSISGTHGLARSARRTAICGDNATYNAHAQYADMAKGL